MSNSSFPPFTYLQAIPALILLGLGLLISIGAPPVAYGQERTGTVTGRVIMPHRDATGSEVVLRRFTLNDQGKPAGAPVARQTAGKNGTYRFESVVIASKAVYRLSTRIDGELASSNLFTFPDGQNEVTIDLDVAAPAPAGEHTGTVKDGAVGIEQALLVVDSAIGRLWITEVLHISNRSGRAIDRKNDPLTLPISADAENFTVLRGDEAHGSISRDGGSLKFTGSLLPGNSTIAYRYSQGVFWGSANLDRRYGMPVSEVVVLTPPNTVQVGGAGFVPRGEQKVQSTTYASWGRSSVPENTIVEISVRGVPISQNTLLAPLALFAVIMAGMLWWFVRRRMRRVAS